MKEVVIKRTDKEPITIIVTDTELKIAKNLGLSERQYIESKVKITLEEEYKEKNT
jgi:hypothetical protein